MSPHRRASRVRVTVLAGAVALAAALPLAIAMAGTPEVPAVNAADRPADGARGGDLLTGDLLTGDLLAGDLLADGLSGDDGSTPVPGGATTPGGTTGPSGPMDPNGPQAGGPRQGGDPEVGGVAAGGSEAGGGGSNSLEGHDSYSERAERLPGSGAPRAGGTGKLSGFRAQGVLARGPAAVCGPEVSSPAGVTAQTCVLSQEGHSWGRMYYRNTGGAALRGVLTLMRPDGRTVQVHCVVAEGPALCETPRQRTVHPVGDEPPYHAVAEIAPPGDDVLLLRAGSNPPDAFAD